MSDTFRSTAVVVCVNNFVNQIVHVIFNMPYKRATNSCQRPFLTNALCWYLLYINFMC